MTKPERPTPNLKSSLAWVSVKKEFLRVAGPKFLTECQDLVDIVGGDELAQPRVGVEGQAGSGHLESRSSNVQDDEGFLLGTI